MLSDEELRELYNKAGADKFTELGLNLADERGFDGHLEEMTFAALRAVYDAGRADA